MKIKNFSFANGITCPVETLVEKVPFSDLADEAYFVVNEHLYQKEEKNGLYRKLFNSPLLEPFLENTELITFQGGVCLQEEKNELICYLSASVGLVLDEGVGIFSADV